MSPLGRQLVRAISAKKAETAAEDVDPRLRGRTYAIPFDEVWETALALVKRRRSWHVVTVDDEEGVIRVEAKTFLFRLIADVEIRITLDENAQTRVDSSSASRRGFADWGVNARRIGRFMRKLDKTLVRNRKQRAAAQRAA
ncbi:MAG: DUF1499 domain-containing protein [Longimicrobiales bacterium]